MFKIKSIMTQNFEVNTNAVLREELIDIKIEKNQKRKKKMFLTKNLMFHHIKLEK